ncbi:MAG: hypothetical protein H0V53_07275 [Rubrobacter sp.]|nr:hypothetical protein [Rubrobacter sp.]
MERRSQRKPASPAGPRQRRGVLPPWMTLVFSILVLAVSFFAIFFVVEGCVATQEATEVRKYVTNSGSLLSDSQAVGNGELEEIVRGAAPGEAGVEVIARASEESGTLYRQALTNEEVPPEFEEAHYYLVSALGIRASATRDLLEAAEAGAEDLEEAVPAAVNGYRLSDRTVSEYYVPASRAALGSAGQASAEGSVYEPEPFMDYDSLGLPAEADGAELSGNPDAIRGVEVSEVRVAGEQLSPGGNVTLTGSDATSLEVDVGNGGEVTETSVPVEVVLNTSAERQTLTATVESVEPGETATVEVSGFRPGEPNEVAEIEVEAGPVEGEELLENNTLAGTVTFGI